MFARLRNQFSSHTPHVLSPPGFLCPNCLCFSSYDLACGACWLKVEDSLIGGNGDCVRCRQPLQENVRACCQQCWCGCGHAAYHQRPVRVLATLRASDYASFCQAVGVRRPRERGAIGYGFDDGKWLAYVLNLGDFIKEESFLNTDAFQEVKSIWVDAAGNDTEASSLSLGEAADRFIGRADLTESQRRALTVCVRQAAVEFVVGHVLETRFGLIKHGVGATDYLHHEAHIKVEDLGVVRCNLNVPAYIDALKGSSKDGPERAAVALVEIGNPALPALIDTLTVALNDSDWGVSRKAAEALGGIGDRSAALTLIGALKCLDWKTRETAAYALGRIGDESAAPALSEALKDREVRYGATDALEKIGKSAVPALVNVLADGDIDARYFAARALGKIGDRSAVPAFLAALKDSGRDVFYSVAMSLERIGAESAVPALVAALTDGDPGIRYFALAILQRIGVESAVFAFIGALKDGDPDVREKAVESLVGIGAPAIPELMDALKDRDVRYGATDVLERIGQPAVPALIAAFRDSDSDVGEVVVHALERIGGPAVPALVDALGDNDWKVREAAAEALGRIGDRSGVPALIAALKAGDEKVREAAAEALGRIGDGSAVPALCDAFMEGVGNVSGKAADGLVRIGEPAVPALVDALKYMHVRPRASAALERIGKAAVSALVNELKNDDPDVRYFAARTLGGIGDESAAPALSKALKGSDKKMRAAAAAALGRIGGGSATSALGETLKDSVWDVSRAARDALVEIGEPAIPALIIALKYRDQDASRAAAEALVKIGKPAVPALIAALRDEDVRNRRAEHTLILTAPLEESEWDVWCRVVEALGRIGDKSAVPALILELTYRHEKVRAAAAEALGRIGDESAVPALSEALKDRNRHVASKATEALRKIQNGG